MKERIMYKEIISHGRVDAEMHEVIRSFPDWEHEVVGYARTNDHRKGERSSVLIKFWKEVVE